MSTFACRPRRARSAAQRARERSSDEGAARGCRDPVHLFQRAHKDFSLFASREIRRRENERAHQRIDDCGDFQLTSTDLPIFRQHDPFPRTGNRQPFGILCAGQEMFMMKLDLCAGDFEGFGDEVPSKALVDKVDQGGFTPPPRARTGSLRRSPLAGDHSRTPDLPAIRRL